MLDFFLDNFYNSNGLLDTPIQEIEYTVLDFETTGLYPYNGDRIIEAGMVRIKNQQMGQTYEGLFNPQIPIPEEVSQINHITDDMVAQAPLIDEKIDEIVDFLQNSVIVGHNLSFDISFLNYQLEKLQKPKVDLWLVDTIKVTKMVLPELERYTLGKITDSLGIENKDAHRALADTEATAEMFLTLIKKLPGDLTLKGLQAFKMK